MQTFESGREASLLKDIKSGAKTVEGRLAKGKFLDYQVGDHVKLRADHYNQVGKLIKSEPNQAEVVITKIEHYPDFKTMLAGVGYLSLVPRAKDVDEALDELYKYYTLEQEQRFGAIAIYFELLK
ncbi:MAG TPA: ASCH domain-containing protein [Candidatus Saccharimonadales bacterium]|nr:ASCH domain-containing protein [Candidatus Saccharimonadales bacterium]